MLLKVRSRPWSAPLDDLRISANLTSIKDLDPLTRVSILLATKRWTDRLSFVWKYEIGWFQQILPLPELFLTRAGACDVCDQVTTARYNGVR